MAIHAGHERLLTLLRSTAVPMSGRDLASRLGVSTRTVRAYVTSINLQSARPIVVAEHRGYSIAPEHAAGVAAVRRDRRAPEQRMLTIARRLIRASDGEDVHELAELLSVSQSAIEADLAKVRMLLREFDLNLVRQRDRVRLGGSEANQRRFVRQLILGSARGAAAIGLEASMRELNRYELPTLSRILESALAAHDVALHDYGLADLTLHLAIALERIQDGHAHADVGRSVDRGGRADAIVGLMASEMHRELGVEFPDGERSGFADLISARTIVGPVTAPEDEYVTLVRRITADLSSHYLLDIDDEVFALNLSLHVKHLLERARAGTAARNPLRATFKQSHPLIHELAVFMASRIEDQAGIRVNEDEIAYLALHLGAYLQRSLEDADRVSVTCVVARYYESHHAFVGRLEDHLGDGVSIDTVEGVHPDWDAIGSDLIVTTLEPPSGLAPTVLVVSPILSRSDLDRISDDVRRRRAAKSAARIRWTMSELMDPRLFHSVERITQDAALQLLCETLVGEGVAHARFERDVRERERLSSTAFGELIAVPHSIHMDCHRTAISILISKNPIPWGDSEVRMVALFTLSPTGRHVFRDVLDAFIATLADSERMDRIVEAAEDYEDVVRAIVAEAGPRR